MFSDNSAFYPSELHGNENWQKIGRFGIYFERYINFISSLTIKGGLLPAEIVFKKTLYVAIIDALSNVVCSNKKNRERMIFFLIDFTNWSNWEKISLPHLVKLMEKDNDPEFLDLRKYASDLIDRCPKVSPINLDIDIDRKEVEDRWPKDKRLLGKDIKCLAYLNHANLFYTYRNALIHESNNLTNAIELPHDGDKPVYHRVLCYNGNVQDWRWELIYPVGFFEKICREGLTLQRNIRGSLKG